MTTDERLKEIADIENRYDGWWCPRCNRSVPPTEATFEERHDGCGGQLIGLDEDGVDSVFAAQEAIKARDALRRIREVASDQPFANSSQRRIWKAAVDLCNKILED